MADTFSGSQSKLWVEERSFTAMVFREADLKKSETAEVVAVKIKSEKGWEAVRLEISPDHMNIYVDGLLKHSAFVTNPVLKDEVQEAIRAAGDFYGKGER